MTTQLINQTTDFSGTLLVDVTELQFTNPGALATATFAGSQFGTQIASNVLITGNVRDNAIAVALAGSSFDASGWQFALWGAADTVTLTGSFQAETIIGSVQEDDIVGGFGADTIRGHLGTDLVDGGAGNDRFLFGANGANGAETIIGGDDNDSIVIFSAGNHDLSGADISEVENLVLVGDTSATMKPPILAS